MSKPGKLLTTADLPAHRAFRRPRWVDRALARPFADQAACFDKFVGTWLTAQAVHDHFGSAAELFARLRHGDDEDDPLLAGVRAMYMGCVAARVEAIEQAFINGLTTVADEEAAETVVVMLETGMHTTDELPQALREVAEPALRAAEDAVRPLMGESWEW